MGPAPELVEAQSFGKYSLVAKLATGGMAEIFLARLQGAAGFHKLVCVKRILPHLAKDQQLVSMFLSEARIAAQISHPNVCSVFELGEIDGRYFIAMEYLEGVPFSCFRRRDIYPGEPDPGLIAGLGLQACEGLHHAHQLKRSDGQPMEVVHRDVSANNLFATVDGVAKVLDFGIAKVQDASVRTSTGSVKGTYAYMAPEQLRGEKLDRRTDVFALGTVLWELFARTHLFKRETDFLTFQAITSDPIPDVCELRPDVPPELGEVIAKALSRDRELRYPTARAMGEALAKSVAAIGGPWSASAISDEISRAFESRLADQRRLIRIAREGGALSLDEDLGPSVGFGTEMIETPVSVVSGRVPPEAISTPVPARRSAPIAIPKGPRSETVQVQLPPAPSRGANLKIALIIVAALVGGGLVMFFLMRNPGTHEPTAPPPTPQVAAAPAVLPDAAVAAVLPDAPAFVPTVAVDAGVAAVPPDAPTPTDTSAGKPKPPVVIPKPTGPPGFITIDTSSGYAVIFIDGKRYGETPLVRQSLPPGKHSVRAVSPSGTVRNVSITIESGKVAPTRRIEW
jgi:serine/threonine-protein kinase